MKKTFSAILLLLTLSTIFIPLVTKAGGIVPCDGVGTPCTLCMVFNMLTTIYTDIVLWAAPLAVIALIVAGIMIMVSAGNPNLASTGKTILKAAIIGLILVFCSYMIIDFIVTTLNPSAGSWASLSLSC